MILVDSLNSSMVNSANLKITQKKKNQTINLNVRTKIKKEKYLFNI